MLLASLFQRESKGKKQKDANAASFQFLGHARTGQICSLLFNINILFAAYKQTKSKPK